MDMTIRREASNSSYTAVDDPGEVIEWSFKLAHQLTEDEGLTLMGDVLDVITAYLASLGWL
jgi:hypothetical protein